MQYYCDDYPVLNLTLAIFTESLSHPLMLTYLADDDITTELPGDGIYFWNLGATNSVGSVATSNRTICKPHVTYK